MNTIEDIFSEYAERITDSAKEQKSTFIQYCIQALLDKKQSVRSIALATGRSESTIRSWIQKGFLKK